MQIDQMLELAKTAMLVAGVSMFGGLGIYFLTKSKPEQQIIVSPTKKGIFVETPLGNIYHSQLQGNIEQLKACQVNLNYQAINYRNTSMNNVEIAITLLAIPESNYKTVCTNSKWTHPNHVAWELLRTLDLVVNSLKKETYANASNNIKS